MPESQSSTGLLYHVDGDLVAAEEATINVRDRGFLYGDAAFETMRAYNGKVFEWDAHMDRLAETCEVLGLEHGLSAGELRERVDETLSANDLREAYVRLSITRGVQPGKLTPDTEVDPTVVVIVSQLPRGGQGSQPVWDGPVTLQTARTKRVPDASIPARAKTHNYLNGILARLELRVTEADEAMMVDLDGHVTEGATSNLFFVQNNALRTPSVDGPILPGITRRVVLEVAREEGIPVDEGVYKPGDIRSADEVFLTNSTWEIRPVETVDGLSVGNGGDGDDEGSTETAAGPVTTLLSRLLDARIESTYYE